MIVPNADVPGGEQIKILDFGIAKLAETETGISEAHTRADALLGTPKYMSPEQCKGSGGVDAKSDVYSLGIIFFELLAGQPPFAGTAHGELIVQHIIQEPPPLASLAEPGTPDTLMRLVHLMLTKDKLQRPTMRQVVGELDRLGGYLSGVYGVVNLGAGSSAPGHNPLTPTPPPGWNTGPGQSSLPGTPSLASFNPAGGPAVRSYPGMTPLPGAVQAAPASTLGLSAGQVPASPPRRFPLSIAIGGLIGGVAVGLLLIFSLNKSPPPPAPPPPPPRPVVQQAPPEPVKQLVQCSLVTTPDGAQVIRQRDGQVLGTTPLLLKLPQGSEAEQVRVVLAGYVEMPLTLSFDKDSEQELELRRKGGRDKRSKDPGAKSKPNGKGYVPSDLTVVD